MHFLFEQSRNARDVAGHASTETLADFDLLDGYSVLGLDCASLTTDATVSMFLDELRLS
jgi:hypothetical protein